MEPLEIVYVAASALRAGKGGARKEAWSTAFQEAIYGYQVMLDNAQTMQTMLNQHVPQTQNGPVLSTPLADNVEGAL